MDKTLVKMETVRLVLTEDGTYTAHVRADKIPNEHGYGHTRESGTLTRTYGRMIARKYLTPLQGARIELSGITDHYMVGSDLWRVYTVAGVAR